MLNRRSLQVNCLWLPKCNNYVMFSMARLRAPAAPLQCDNVTLFQLYLQKTQESIQILQQLMLMSELELEISALDQEINVARLLLCLVELGF